MEPKPIILDDENQIQNKFPSLYKINFDQIESITVGSRSLNQLIQNSGIPMVSYFRLHHKPIVMKIEKRKINI